MLDSSDAHYENAEEELGYQVGQLLTPLTRYKDRGLVYGIDNGAYSGFREREFFALLKRQESARDRCKFVCCPDVVGSARRTLEVFYLMHHRIQSWPIALVAQDGIEDQPIEWGLISAVFIGGSTPFKTSNAAKGVVDAAKILGKWVHMGRVNTRDRAELAESWGVDSIDGTGISRYTHMRKALGENGMFDGVAPRESGEGEK